MAIAVSLDDAAAKAPANLLTLWQAGTLKARVTAFWQAISPLFDDNTPADRPFGNWIAVIAAFAPSIVVYNTPGYNTITTYAQAVDYIYRICKLGANYPALTAAQDIGMLAAYNAQFA